MAQAIESLPVAQAEPMSETATILSMVERASRDPSVDVEKMERLFAMRDKELARVAKQSYTRSMVRAQGEMTRVATNKSNSQTGSKYADFAALDRVLRPIYIAHGFSISWSTRTEGATAACLLVIGDLSHIDGHSEEFEIEMPADGKGPQGSAVMTRTHATGSAFSYGKRYLLNGMFNLAVGEKDDDGNAASAHISEGDESKADAFYQQIKEADNMAELKKVGSAVAASGLPPILLKRVRATYTGRLDKLREKEGAK